MTTAPLTTAPLTTALLTTALLTTDRFRAIERDGGVGNVDRRHPSFLLAEEQVFDSVWDRMRNAEAGEQR